MQLYFHLELRIALRLLDYREDPQTSHVCTVETLGAVIMPFI